MTFMGLLLKWCVLQHSFPHCKWSRDASKFCFFASFFLFLSLIGFFSFIFKDNQSMLFRQHLFSLGLECFDWMQLHVKLALVIMLREWQVYSFRFFRFHYLVKYLFQGAVLLFDILIKPFNVFSSGAFFVKRIEIFSSATSEIIIN